MRVSEANKMLLNKANPKPPTKKPTRSTESDVAMQLQEASDHALKLSELLASASKALSTLSKQD